MRNQIWDFLFPRRCPVCKEPVGLHEGNIHSLCRKRLLYLNGTTCRKCGKQLLIKNAGLCEQCQNSHFAFQEGRSVFLYDALMRQSVYEFKYDGCPEYGNFYGQEMAHRYGKWIQSRKIDALVPVPIHIDKLRVRGYNQATVLANEVGFHTGIPVRDDLLIRPSATIPQKGLGRQERMMNLRGAFTGISCNNPPKRVLLIDDLYTTGSTVHACTVALQKIGIEECNFLTIASGGED